MHLVGYLDIGQENGLPPILDTVHLPLNNLS